MCQQQMQPSMSLGPNQPSRHEPSASPAGSLEGSSLRKRPLFPSDKPPLAPRAIQPRPPASTASFGSESGTSAHLSSSFENVAGGEPPRKRGRPSKAETERRRAAAEARGEAYPPPRRSGHGRLKHESTPNSPAGVEQQGPSFPPNTELKSPEEPKPEVHHEPPENRASMAVAPSIDQRTRSIPDRDTGPPVRELPRPPDLRQMLPSPQALQLGPRETVLPRIGTGERPFESFVSPGISLAESSRRVLVDPSSRTQPQPSVSGPQVTSGTTTEK